MTCSSETACFGCLDLRLPLRAAPNMVTVATELRFRPPGQARGHVSGLVTWPPSSSTTSSNCVVELSFDGASRTRPRHRPPHMSHPLSPCEDDSASVVRDAREDFLAKDFFDVALRTPGMAAAPELVAWNEKSREWEDFLAKDLFDVVLRALGMSANLELVASNKKSAD